MPGRSPGRSVLLNGVTTGLSSFALVNRRVCAGLRHAGFDVWPADDPGLARRTDLPDLCLTHGHPYDAGTAPGRGNVFVLEYEYARFAPSEAALATALNARFDACVVPSTFVRRACEASGIEIPLPLCPLGVDFAEFHPGAPPVPLRTQKGFRFVYVGGPTDRKGVDVLVRAYRAEFEADEDVALVLKTHGYDHVLPWFEGVLAENDGGPEILHEHGPAGSIAGYFTAADVGVFPFRGEAFALPILECLASGRPVIATRGGGPDDYLTAENASFVDATPRVAADGHAELDPNVEDLRRHLRAAFANRGRPVDGGRLQASVAAFSWERTVDRMAEILDETWAAVNRRSFSGSDGVVHAYGALGVTSWKKVSGHVDQSLRAAFGAVSCGWGDAVPARGFDVLLAQSGFALEHQRRAEENDGPGTRLLLRGNGPWSDVVEITNRERDALGLAPDPPRPVEVWRHAAEEARADILVVLSQASARRYVAAGRAPGDLVVVPLGFTCTRPRVRSRSDPLRFLFIGTAPYRKGLRVLLEAWDAVRPPRAELLCLTNTAVLESKSVLRFLVRNPSIVVKPLVPPEELGAVFDEVDCQILPSFEDGFSIAIAEGMGRGVPAIVSDETGIVDLLEHGRDARVVATGSVEALRDEIARACGAPAALGRLGAEAFETARRRPWARFEEEVVALVASLRGGRDR